MRRRDRPYMRQFYRGNVGALTLAVLLTLVSTAANLMVSWLIQQIIDVSTGQGAGFTLAQLALLSLLALGLVVLGYALAYVSKPRFISKAIAQYKNYVFTELSKKSVSAFSAENTSAYISALSNDVNAIETGYLSNLFVLLDQTMLLLGALALMLYYSPTLTAVSVALAALPLLASVVSGGMVAAEEKRVSDRNEAYMSALRDALSGFSVIKAFRAEAQICRLFAKETAAVSDAKERRRKKGVIVAMLSGTAGVALQFGVFLIGAWLALRGSGLSAGTVLVFVQLLNYVIGPIGTVPQALAERKAAKLLIEKLDAQLSAHVREEGRVAKDALTDGITVDNLTFGYESGTPILRDVSFRFEAGKSYCIVGASGSGKSTLLSLLLAAHDGYGGRIAYDGVDVQNLSSESLYGMVALVQQHVFVFNASIRDNITLFADFPQQAVDRAIRLSGLSALIAQKGEDYPCGENGSGLSGGERQRVSIARSLLRRAQVLLADEATAALDPQTAHQVSSVLLGLDGVTRIVVTHALDESLLARYDCILALKNGVIAESGTFNQLIAQKGDFYSLYTVAQ